jgi:hypothetical protein
MNIDNALILTVTCRPFLDQPDERAGDTVRVSEESWMKDYGND